MLYNSSQCSLYHDIYPILTSVSRYVSYREVVYRSGPRLETKPQFSKIVASKHEHRYWQVCDNMTLFYMQSGGHCIRSTCPPPILPHHALSASCHFKGNLKWDKVIKGHWTCPFGTLPPVEKNAQVHERM